MKLIFCMQIKHQSSLQVVFNTLSIIFFYKAILSLLMVMTKHSQSIQSSKIAISLQCLKKEARDGVYFLHVDKHQTCHNLALPFLMEVARHVQSTQNRKLVIFLQYYRKKLLQLRLSSILMQNIPIFYWG